MSRYSGKQSKGIRRSTKNLKIIEAYNRALAIWNDSTGWIWTDGKFVRVGHPYFTLPKALRPVESSTWPIKNADFPKVERLLSL